MRRFLLLCLLLPSLALADARDDARRLFRQGIELIDQGLPGDGAAKLQQAYELSPHPSVLYNIGLAWADAGELSKAIDAFQRYLASQPADAAAVERLVEVLLRDLAGDPTPPDPGTQDLTELAGRLDALAARLERLAPAEVPVDPDALRQRTDVYAEQVVSASRTVTSRVDAPSAMTVIAAAEIRQSGLTSVPDLLRRVPGVSVLTMTSGNTNVAVRGFNQRLSNKVLTLVDGRSTYFDFLGGTLFHSLSVDLADLERVEVVRGPGSTLYGANAFGGVINLVTRPPGADPGGQVALTGGTGETMVGTARFSLKKGPVALRTSVGYEQTNRYELAYAERADYAPTMKDPDLGVRALRANGMIELRPDEDTRVAVSGGAAHVFDNFFAIGLFRDFWLQGVHSDLRVDVGWKGLAVRAFWNHLGADAAPSWQPVGGIDLSTRVAAHVVDVEGSWGGAFATGPVRHQVTVGGGWRLKHIGWSYIGAPRLEQHFNAFAEDRITLARPLAVVAGLRVDHHPLVGFTPSPQVAVLLKPTDRQAIRVSASTAFRTPTFLESYLDLVVPTGVVTGVGVRSQGNDALRPENVVSAELGWVFEDSEYVHADVAGWYERVADLIELGPIAAPERPAGHEGGVFVAGTSQFRNAPGVFHGVGGEAAVHAFPVLGLDVRGAYSFAYWIDQLRKDAGEEDFRDRRHPMHSASLGVTYRAPFGLDANVDFQAVSAVEVPERAFDTDGSVLQEACAGDAYPLLSARLGWRFFGDRLEVAVTGFHLTGWASGGHREHCLGSLVRPRVLGSVFVRF